MPTKAYFSTLSLLLVLSLSEPLLGQDPLDYLYPVHPDCLDSTGTAVQQKRCTEATLQAFFLQQVDWSKTEKAYSGYARFYLNINKIGELDGYGIRSCRDLYLVQRFLEIAESLPLQNWLPSIKNGELQDSRIDLNLKWYNHQLDSVWVDGLRIHAPTKRRIAPLELIGDGSEFPDGHEGFARYLNYAIELPQDSALLHKINGKKLPLRLTAESIGTVSKIDILFPLHPVIDSLVMNVLRKGPKWSPGFSNGANQIRIALCTLVFHPYQQNTGEEIREVSTTADFPGGQASFLQFLASHLGPLIKSMKPEEVPEGMVILQLFFNPDGGIYHTRILKNSHPLTDRWIFEMVKKMPNWDMYRPRLKPQKSMVEFPIRIKVE
ncbi:hypothetical protein [Haliscomenobacter sp.]|uniref:hypothetical protein n=1 Tax=Haliscomenobacter sp. TaxID=2717303 RepID=UPI003BA8AA04